MLATLLTVAVALVPLIAGLPSDARTMARPGGEEPCKQVGDAVNKWLLDNHIVHKNLTPIEQYFLPSLPAAPILPSIAFACLKSIPIHKDLAVAQLEFLHPIFEWQSTLDYLRDPPQGYLSEGVDLMRGLDEIASKLKQEHGYANEFEFLAELYTLTSVRVRDVHFRYSSMLMDLFTFRMGAQFVSISEDGVSTPKIFLHDDMKHAQQGYTPSPVSTIDGVPAAEFLLKASVRNGHSHDPDARFNGLLQSLASDASLSFGRPEAFALGLADTTTIKCKNGTTLKFTNQAFVRGNFSGINSGEDLYRSFGQGNGTGPSPFSWLSYELSAKNSTPNFTGYPEAVKSSADGGVIGFLPDSADLSDVAVLAVNSFSNSLVPTNFDPSDIYTEFYNVTADFLRAAKAAGRTKLILDLQGNGGGYLANLANLYRALFPIAANLPILWQARAHTQLAWLGEYFFNSSAPAAPWPLFGQTKPNDTPWTSFSEIYGPAPADHNLKKYGAYTTPSLYGISDVTTNSKYAPPFSTSPFLPSSIILLTDGQCASACSLFVTTLTHGHGVRTIAFGGRPSQGPMQAVGKTKGGPAMTFGQFPRYDENDVPAGLKLPPNVPTFPPRDGEYVPPLRLTGNRLFGWGQAVGFNVDNTVPLKEGGGGMPLQMRYEAADCRVFGTWEMATDASALWSRVVDVAWKGGRCVPGSTGRGDGRMGGERVGYQKRVEDRYSLGKGPGAL
ncbi:hypothetical protein C8A05DRAFT_18050 [Staphylotrichum tortipilum]|uniref:Tail specific protease domain-containing protein n=1 Tax=Staphylotrichum tortipilum TaxID=2831512 RepID=A0AAN6MG74_9PEZI|nr:hypothetical protein C8A05DRAFT_18050 [Staphylotrichum longicolle]